MKKQITIISVLIFSLVTVFYFGCSKIQPVTVGLIADNVFDPEEWGKVYPLEYESWKKTKDPKPTGKSVYKRGWDEDKVTYDKLSEFPYAALLYNGWGFGIEYNEPRGHYYAVIDQVDIDPSRTGAGGVCLACKSPYHKTLAEQNGMKYLKMPFKDALSLLPVKMREMGPSCIDCHDNKTMSLKTNKLHLDNGLKMIGKSDVSRQEARILACAQCHITYYVPRDKDGKVAGDVQLPWANSKWGDISIENIIEDLLKDFQRLEWKQSVTGFRMPYIRHPEFELFTKGSTHFNAGVSCADCHMPYKRVGSYKISDHDVTSPLKTDLKACAQCHTESATWLKNQVMETQNRTISLSIRAGYAVATTAKLIEIANANTAKVDKASFDRSVDLYKKAFLRLNFISAENSTGFHNPVETARVLGDSIAFAGKAESMLRQNLVKANIDIPEFVNLEISKYVNGRGKKKLNFKPEQEFKDPYGIQKEFTTDFSKGLR